MKIEDQVQNLTQQMQFLQFRVAELEGHLFTLQRDDGLIKDVLHQRILEDNASSSDELHWSLELKPKVLMCQESLSSQEDKVDGVGRNSLASTPKNEA